MATTGERQGRLVLIRHGATSWSQSGRHTGLTDLELTPEGEQAASALREPLAAYDFAVVRTSPLRRAARTAELAGLQATPDPRLVEWDYGGYEGLTTPQIRERTGTDWTVFDDGVVPGSTPGETIADVAARARAVLDDVDPQLAHGDVALVAHGHLLRVLAAVRLGRPPQLAAQLMLDAAAICVLADHRGRAAIERWNHVQHPGVGTSGSTAHRERLTRPTDHPPAQPIE
ncbi:MAG TPA: histidine phosphatase family protein [Dermatophilaceae bacterium]|nr:histidine phosphatase family protein [Dermatophilaceae bacterium]